MTRLLRWGCAAVIVTLAGCAQTPPPAPHPAPLPGPALSQTDMVFLEQAALGGIADVQFGQLAAAQAARPNVRQFATQLVSDRTKVNGTLATLAQSKGVALPEQIDPAHGQILDRLQRERGAVFDHDYLRSQISDHEAAQALYQREANEGTDPDLRAFAAQDVPNIERHLQEARALYGTGP
jgi:putative membrane protein